MSYPFNNIDQKWQKAWAENQCFKTNTDTDKETFYALDMFPYPSGSGLHVGHLASYTPTDVISRKKRNEGFEVLHPMGYDAFGLPAEQYAIQTGVHPEVTTQNAIENFRRQLKSFGYSYDWDREISTANPEFYKWTQYIFSLLVKKGLAYQKEVPVNWCPELKTVLANEEIVDGKSERGGHPVVRLPMKQWMLKITDYAERLLQDLELVDWPQRTVESQKNWIGKSVGAEVTFNIEKSGDSVTVFTTRPDTLFGATFMVLAPEHPLVSKITTDQQKPEVKNYIDTTASKSELDRKVQTEKTGVFTGAYVLNPVSNKQMPVWISDYVLMDYGSGAIMAVPAHDERDFEFAQKFELPITAVLKGPNNEELPFTGEGELIESDFLNGLSKIDAINKMISYLEENKLGVSKTLYKLRDWLFSRQRYWGEPIPVIHGENGVQTLEQDELPLTLPEVPDYEPTDSGDAPLARITDWINTERGERESHTMPGSAGSSWYFLRYIDPKNSKQIIDPALEEKWMPVDLYIGGAEHTVGHLLYSRFWQKVLFDAGYVKSPEPFKTLKHQGLVLGPDGEKMSKSRGNVVNPDDVKKDYGADSIRCYICFMGPFEKDKPWNTKGIDGVKRFLDRVWRLAIDEHNKVKDFSTNAASDKILKDLHKTIKKVGEDIDSLSLNTALSSLMIFTNELYKEKTVNQNTYKDLLILLSPFAPHVCEELWSRLGYEGFISLAPWPKYDESLCKDDSVQMGVQVNGKMRGTITIAIDATEENAIELAKELSAVQAQLKGKNLFKVIYKAGKILNLIAK